MITTTNTTIIIIIISVTVSDARRGCSGRTRLTTLTSVTDHCVHRRYLAVADKQEDDARQADRRSQQPTHLDTCTLDYYYYYYYYIIIIIIIIFVVVVIKGKITLPVVSKASRTGCIVGLHTELRKL